MFPLFKKSKVCKNCDNWYETEEMRSDKLDRLLTVNNKLLEELKENKEVSLETKFELEKILYEFKS